MLNMYNIPETSRWNRSRLCQTDRYETLVSERFPRCRRALTSCGARHADFSRTMIFAVSASLGHEILEHFPECCARFLRDIWKDCPRFPDFQNPRARSLRVTDKQFASRRLLGMSARFCRRSSLKSVPLRPPRRCEEVAISLMHRHSETIYKSRGNASLDSA
jgi:hypothetical protein